MRPFHAVALALSIVAAAGTASAKQPKPKKVTAAPKASKKVITAFAVPQHPEPIAAIEPAQPAPAPAPAPGPTPAPTPDPSVPLTSVEPERDSARDADRALAKEEAAARPISVAPLLGAASGGLRFGAGVRAGYTLPSNLYVGAAFMYHFGHSIEILGTKRSSSALYPSAEVGYDIRFGRLVVRPYGGAAVVVAMSSSSLAGNEQRSDSLASGAIYPGCAVTYDVPRSGVFVGGDGRLLYNFDTGSSFGVFGSAGIRF